MERVEIPVASTFSGDTGEGQIAMQRKAGHTLGWYRRQHCRTGQLRAEGALMWAILEDALKCYQHRFLPGSHQALRLAREAETWLFSDDSSYLCSCVNICAVLELDLQHLRQGLLRWSRSAQHGRWDERSCQELSLS